MISALTISGLYIIVLLAITKYFGVKYTEILKNTETIKKGLLLPVVTGTILLTLYAIYFDWIPDVFSYYPRIQNIILWSVPILLVISIVSHFKRASINKFTKKGLLYLFSGTLFVGFSEELLVRGIVVGSLIDSGYGVMLAGLLSSVIFGTLHFVNYFNGQDIKVTSVQVFGTTLMGINFYVLYIISGTLWIPIIFHFLYDLSILLIGADLNKLSGKESKLELYTNLGLHISAIISLIIIW